jgi:uncharacterized membrane protein YqaE (UPF0057 family)
MSTLYKLFCTLVSFFLPPLGVLLVGASTDQLILNIILTIFFWIPGLIHALYTIFKEKEE